MQVWTKAGRVFTGHPQFVASSAETDDLDFYLEAPLEVFENGDQDPLLGIKGFLISRSEVQYLAVLDSSGENGPGAPEAVPG